MRTETLFVAVTASLMFLGIPAHAAQEDPVMGDQAEGSARTAPDADVTPGDAPNTILPANMKPDQLIQFFTLLSVNESMETAVGPVLEQLTQTGEPVADWTQLGIDILAHLEEREGGAAAWFLRDTDDEVLTLLDFSAQAAPDLAPFQSFALRPEPVGLVAERSFASFIPGIWFETAFQRTKKGNALCYPGYFGITLHTLRPYAQWSQDELLATATVFALVDRLSSLDICMVYDQNENGDYTSRAFTQDGRPLVELNAEMTPAKLLPASELDAFLQRRPSIQGDE
ncbi:MAG: hypothetical protein AAFP79_15810 [Pseudomonadota bacterium]